MKTIHIHTAASCRHTDLLTVNVNGQPHEMRGGSVNVQVDGDKPFRVKVKRGWRGSLEYTFDPMGDMRLQIHSKRTLARKALLIYLPAFAVAYPIVSLRRGHSATGLVLSLAFCVAAFFYIEVYKSYFFIEEVN